MSGNPRPREAWQRLAANDRGNVAALFALLLPAICAAAGLGLDFGQVEAARRAYQSAIDATIEASEMRRELLDDELRDFARDFFNANLDPARVRAVTGFDFQRTGDGVFGKVDASIDTPFFAFVDSPRTVVHVEASVDY